VLVFDDATPEQNTAEDAADGVRIVAALKVRPGSGRLSGCVDAAGASFVRRVMRRDCVASRDELVALRPQRVVDDRRESKTVARPDNAPDAPPDQRLGVVGST
jgi:hypothetical protein